MRQGYEQTESDLNSLIKATKGKLNRNDIEKAIKNHELFEFVDTNSNEINLYRLTFRLDSLEYLDTIELQW